MKNLSQKFCLVLASTALLFAGCSKKPARPAPNQTVLGPAGGGENINPTNLATEPGSGLMPQLGEGVIDDGHTIRGLLKPVYFKFNDSTITDPAERAKLQAAKEYLEKNPGQRLLLEGHCDWRGTAEYNLGLGDRRANATKKYLGTIGVAKDKLESNSKGSLEAKANAIDADAANDRRVELVIIKAP
jgi:peptidoglycan-associated lipoprotein